MIRIILIILLVNLPVADSIGRAQETSPHSDHLPSENKLQEKPEEKTPEKTPQTPEQDSAQPPGPAQPEEAHPTPEEKPQAESGEKTPEPSPAQPAGPAQPQAAQPAPGETPQAKPGEKAPEPAPAQPQAAQPAPGETPQAKPGEKAPEPAPAQPQAAQPAPGETPQAKPGEKTAEKALQTTEEEKKRTVSEAERTVGVIIRGRLELELNETYVHLSSNRLFIEGFGVLPILIVGPTEIQRIRRDSIITSLGVRYKITEDFQADLRAPYQYTFVRTSTATGLFGRREATPNQEALESAHGWGDASGSISYHLLSESFSHPSLYVGLGFKMRNGRDTFETRDAVKNPPMGSGFNSVNLSLNAVKTSDPAVLFGSVGYVYTLSRHNVVTYQPNNQPPILIDFNPGDTINFSVGMAYALNYKITLSIGYQQSVNLVTRIKLKGDTTIHRTLPDSATNAISLRFGTVWRINDKTSIDLSVGPGLTIDAPDVQFSIRIPYRF